MATLHHTAHGTGPTRVLMVHGWLMSSAIWSKLLAELPPGLHTVATPDLRGMGHSSGMPEAGVEGHARDLLTVADAQGWGQFHLVGHSLGGTIAQMIAALEPGRIHSLALLNPVPASGLKIGAEMESHLAGIPGDEAAAREFFAPQFGDAEDAERAVASALATNPAVAKTTLQAWVRADFADRLPRLTMRTLVLAGVNDPFLPEAFLRAELVDRLPAASFSGVDAGHYPHVDHPGIVAERLRAHWAG